MIISGKIFSSSSISLIWASRRLKNGKMVSARWWNIHSPHHGQHEKQFLHY